MHEVNILKNKTKMAENAWLRYYNKILFEQGLISEDTKNKMLIKINQR